MQIRTKIYLSHMAVIATVAVFFVVIIFSLRFADERRRQFSESYEQLRDIYLIANEAHHFVEQIAELIAIGPQDADIKRIYKSLMERLAMQRETVSNEAGRLDDPGERADELREIQLLNNIGNVVQELDEVYWRLAQELAAGRKDAASSLYNAWVENDLDEQLDALIYAALTREQDRVEESFVAAERLSRYSLWLALSMVLIVTGLGVGNILVLNRTVLRPMTALAQAADAVGRGDLSHIVATNRTDELGNLARRFNRMTGQIKAQRDALQATNDNLEQQVAERTRELVARSGELELLNARLNEVDANRVQFFADISHELRTPLTILRGQAEVALRSRGRDPEQTRKTLETIVRKAGQIGRLVEDMLFLARSEAGAITMDMQPTDLQGMIGDALIDSQTLARDKGVSLAPHQPLEPVIVRGDGERLRQAVLILVDNAIKFAPEKTSVLIELAAHEGHAIIRVRDAGPGFSEEATAHVFKRFSGGGASAQSNSGRSVGLGLAIAKWIIDQHGGTITVQSPPGEGATVAIELPLAEEIV
ncbi:MAG: ATP-binding protein [Marinobacter sp.]|uniref:sensor histidine kinase n=1 Tax=Marinobacter sp. TaxID=50741 RepID=UPI003F9E1EE8